MTPFGKKIRQLRKAKGVTQKQMAKDLQITAAYLSALEHGHRGRPAPGMVMQICAYFELIWDQAEELKNLAKLSHPRITIDTSGMTPKATELANLLAENIRHIPDHAIDWIVDEIKANLPRWRGDKS